MLPYQQTIAINSLSELSRFAECLSGWLLAGDVVALNGTLGAGKTTLIRLLGQVLGVQESVTSPTFSLLHEYSGGRFPVLHSDLYRLGEYEPDANEAPVRFVEELLDTAVETGALTLVEWACYAPALNDVISVQLTLTVPEQVQDAEHDSLGEQRHIHIEANRPIPSLQ